MKKLIPIIVIVVVIVGGYLIFSKNGGKVGGVVENINIETQKTDPALIERLQGVSVTASEDGRKVVLVDGKGEFAVEGGKQGTVSIGEVATERKSDKRNDVLTVINVDSGDSTISRYLVLFSEVSGVLTEKSLAFLGGADVKSIVTTDIGEGGTEEYITTVTALVKNAEGDKTTRTFIFTVENGSFNFAKSLEL